LLKKAIVVLAPTAVLIAVAMAPMSSSADTFIVTVCPAGTTNPIYCTHHKVKKCKVPKLIGKVIGVNNVRGILFRHDCRLGTTTRYHHGKVVHNKKRGPVTAQSRRRGRVLPNKTKVNIKVKV